MVCRSVALSVTLVSTAKTDGPFEMPFWLWTWVSPGNHVLDGGSQLLRDRQTHNYRNIYTTLAWRCAVKTVLHSGKKKQCTKGVPKVALKMAMHRTSKEHFLVDIIGYDHLKLYR